MIDCLGDIGDLLGLKGHFRGQKEWFKTILGPVSGLFFCYYNWLSWSDPKPDTEKYPHSFFYDLYHSRWPVEEDYKAIKCRIELENFSGKSALSVYQDFHAKVLMKNIVSIFALSVNDMLAADKTTDQKYDYQVNLTHALATVKDLMPLLFQRSKRKIKLIIEALLELLQRTVEPIRPGRQYPRKHRVSSRKYYICYKRIA